MSAVQTITNIKVLFRRYAQGCLKLSMASTASALAWIRPEVIRRHNETHSFHAVAVAIAVEVAGSSRAAVLVQLGPQAGQDQKET